MTSPARVTTETGLRGPEYTRRRRVIAEGSGQG